MITRWLPATNTLVVIERIYRYQFKSNYLKNHGLLTALFMNFRYLHEISNVLKKNELHTSSISELVESERCAYLNE